MRYRRPPEVGGTSGSLARTAFPSRGRCQPKGLTDEVAERQVPHFASAPALFISLDEGCAVKAAEGQTTTLGLLVCGRGMASPLQRCWIIRRVGAGPCPARILLATETAFEKHERNRNKRNRHTCSVCWFCWLHRRKVLQRPTGERHQCRPYKGVYRRGGKFAHRRYPALVFLVIANWNRRKFPCK